MTTNNEQQRKAKKVIGDYERRVLQTFVQWYRQANRTLEDASSQAYTIAKGTVGGLTASQTISILQEHPEWTHEEPEESYSSDTISITIGEITRRHIIHHLEKFYSNKWHTGSLYLSRYTRMNTRKPYDRGTYHTRHD